MRPLTNESRAEVWRRRRRNASQTWYSRQRLQRAQARTLLEVFCASSCLAFHPGSELGRPAVGAMTAEGSPSARPRISPGNHKGCRHACAYAFKERCHQCHRGLPPPRRCRRSPQTPDDEAPRGRARRGHVRWPGTETRRQRQEREARAAM